MSNGEGCKRLIKATLGDGTRKYRVCAARHGFLLKQWRCVGQDSPDCPGFVPKSNRIEDGAGK